MKAIFNSEIQKIRGVMTEMPWENPSFYASYLAQTYYFVQHSTRLLALASAHAPLDQTSLHRRFASHIGEEKGHDLIALHDMKKLGVSDLEAELPETRNLYEGQYYKIEKQSSAALFGYILALEGVASLVCPQFIDRIYKAHGVEAARFLKLHVEEDPDHVEKAFEQIEALPAEQKTLAEINLVQSFRNYSQFMNSIKENYLRPSLTGRLPSADFDAAP